MYTAPASKLRVIFPRPGFMLTDIFVDVLLDRTHLLDRAATIYRAPFSARFLCEGLAAPGTHNVTVALRGHFHRETDYRVDVRPGCVTELHLSYSRLWGNFTKTADVRYAAA